MKIQPSFLYGRSTLNFPFLIFFLCNFVSPYGNKQWNLCRISERQSLRMCFPWLPFQISSACWGMICPRILLFMTKKIQCGDYSRITSFNGKYHLFPSICIHRKSLLAWNTKMVRSSQRVGEGGVLFPGQRRIPMTGLTWMTWNSVHPSPGLT